MEQYYQDHSLYPDKWAAFSWVALYTPKFPIDPKTWLSSGNTSFDLAYNVKSDTNSVTYQEYELSTGFENVGTTTAKAGWDGGSDANRLEEWIDIGTIDTTLRWNQTNVVSWAGTPTSAADATTCVTKNSATLVACDVASAWTNVMVIR